MLILSWFIPVASAERTVAAVPRAVDVCRSYFNFLSLPCAKSGGTEKGSTIYALITKLIVFILEISATVAVALLVYAGILYITSSAVPETAAKAKKIMIYSIVGLLVIGFAFVITTAVKELIMTGIEF